MRKGYVSQGLIGMLGMGDQVRSLVKALAGPQPEKPQEIVAGAQSAAPLESTQDEKSNSENDN